MSDPIKDQPLPIPNDTKPVWELVIEDMRERDKTGRERYGTPLQIFNGREAAVDRYQELLDEIAYARQDIEERRILDAELARLRAELQAATEREALTRQASCMARDIAEQLRERAEKAEADLATARERIATLERQYIAELGAQIAEGVEAIEQCAYCGHQEATREEIMKHVQGCPQHPISAMQKRIAALEADGKRLATLRPASEYHEDYGTVLWWHLPICEPPYIGAGEGMNDSNADGTPTDCRRLIEEGWLTHWTPIPQPAIDAMGAGEDGDAR